MPVDKNLGFAGGNNAAIRPILAVPQPPDYILLLNPDTVVRPGALRGYMDFMEQHPEVGNIRYCLNNGPPADNKPCLDFQFLPLCLRCKSSW